MCYSASLNKCHPIGFFGGQLQTSNGSPSLSNIYLMIIPYASWIRMNKEVYVCHHKVQQPSPGLSIFNRWVLAEWLRRCLQQWGARGVSNIPTLASTSWSNSLIIGIYPAVSARRHVLMFSSYKIISIRIKSQSQCWGLNTCHFRDPVVHVSISLRQSVTYKWWCFVAQEV